MLTKISRVGGQAIILQRRLAGSASGGIQFDTYPQAGGWLYVETNHGAFDSPNNYGIELHDYSSAGFGIGIIADVNDVQVHGLNMEIAQYADPSVFAGAIDCKLVMSSLGGVELAAGLTTATGKMRLAAAADVGIDFNTSGLGTGKLVISEDGFTTFEFWSDGSVHGLASVGAITWDLV